MVCRLQREKGAGEETHPMKPETSSALERLQADPRKDGQGQFKWLDAHRDDMVAVLKEMGARVTCALLGQKPTTVYTWLQSRGLKEGIVSAGPAGQARVPAAGQQPLAYWRGKAEALEMVVKLLLKEKETPQ